MCQERILLCILVLIKVSVAINKDAYMVLSTKLQGVSMEVGLIRNELVTTSEKLENIENRLRLENGENGRVLSSSGCGDTGEQDDTVINATAMNTEIQQFMSVVRVAWKSEKKQARRMERRMNQELIKTNSVVNDAKKDIELEIENVKETLSGTTTKVSEILQRLDTVENDVADLKNYQTDLLASLQADRVRMDKLESEFQNQQQVLAALNEELKSTKSELSAAKTNINGKLLTLADQQADKEKCQSGNGVGAHAYPSRAFPYTVTVRFDPPFKKMPAFVYGTVLLDATDNIRYNAQLKRLTNEYFTISMNTWATYFLWGARVSWMACPK